MYKKTIIKEKEGTKNAKNAEIRVRVICICANRTTYTKRHITGILKKICTCGI